MRPAGGDSHRVFVLEFAPGRPDTSALVSSDQPGQVFPLEVQRLPAGCAGMGDLAAVCSPPVRFPLVMPAQKAFATTFASRPPALKPLR